MDESLEEEDLEDMTKRESRERALLRPYNVFFKRVLNIAAESLHEMSNKIGLTEEVSELIWCIVKALLS
jgi:hypothetical protein